MQAVPDVGTALALQQGMMRSCGAIVLLLVLLAPAASWGADPAANPPADLLADFIRGSQPTLDVRSRWENADETHLRGSNAATLRIRLGLRSPEVDTGYGLLQGFIEYEGTEVADTHSYLVPSGPGTSPIQGTPGKTPIADPKSHELNRAWLRYSGFDSEAKYGRQRIILDNARFVGNVGWRQNEQTFDSVRFTNRSVENLELDYAYLWHVQRIFGSESSQNTANGDYDSQTHLVHASFSGIPHATVKAYAYFMDLENGFTSAPSNKTWGASVTGSFPVSDVDLGYYGAWAYQSDYRDTPVGYDTSYLHVKLWAGFRGFELGVAEEVLNEDGGIGFQTPLATLHAFDGWADVFLATPAAGLIDRYAWLRVPLPFGVGFQVIAHRFDPSGSSGQYGKEFDFALRKVLPYGVVALAKAAFYDSDISTHLDSPGTPAGDNVRRFWLQLSYAYN